jgi:hypothetical protein
LDCGRVPTTTEEKRRDGEREKKKKNSIEGRMSIDISIGYLLIYFMFL